MKKSQKDSTLSVLKSKSKKAKPKILVILGQTATGKSDLAVSIAKKFNGEVISADSRQVYTGMDIGTGKITKKEMQGVKHYLLDVENPKNTFTIAGYRKLADEAILEILNKGKMPIICGGTGFYINAVTEGIILPEVPPDINLRKKLQTKNESELLNILRKIDPKRAKNIDAKNKVRLIRSIEIAKALGRVPKLAKVKPKYDFVKIGLTLPSPEITQKIQTRLEKRFKSGMLKEAVNLHKKGLSFKRMRELGLEYRYMALYLEKKISKSEMIEKLNTEILRYAKRQMTWFKRDKDINWFNPKQTKNIESYLKSRISLE